MSTASLEKAWRDAEAKAIKLQREKDEALGKVRERFTDRLRGAVDEAAAAQKVWLDAQVAESLRVRLEAEKAAAPDADRYEAESVARSLGVSLDEE